MEVLGPYLPLAQRLGRLATSLAEASSIERVECEYLGHLAGRDTRLLTLATLNGVLAGHTEEVERPGAGRAQDQIVLGGAGRRAGGRDHQMLSRDRRALGRRELTEVDGLRQDACMA